MAYPASFDEFLQSQVVLINLKRRPERLERSLRRLRDAGFTNIRVEEAVDAANGDAHLAAAWARHGSPRLNPYDKEFFSSFKGKQGCMLSHLNVLQYVIQHEIPYFIVFEDDVLFYEKWSALAPEYYANTPKTYDLLYLGAWIEGACNTPITTNPCLCTNAMAMTLEGARRIYRFLTTHPYGAYTIDCMLYNYELNRTRSPDTPFEFSWYAWNTRHLTGDKDKKSGLVLQDEDFVSDVRP